MPKISIIVPVYNGEKTILATIESIQKQTFFHFELIVIDDGSTDCTLELLAQICEPRMKVISYENGGLPVARNRGIANAIGEFITFIDADDLWTSDKLELQLAALQQHPEADVVYSWTLFLNEAGTSFHQSEPIYFQGNILPQLLLKNFIASGSNVMIRKQAIASVGYFDPTLRSCEDWDYWLRLAAKCAFAVVPKYQIIYRQSTTAMSSKVEVMEKHLLIVHERGFRLASPELQFLKNQSLANIYEFLAHLCLSYIPGNTGAKQAYQKLRQAIILYPLVLLSKRTQVLLTKTGLLLLSPISENILQKIKILRAKKVESINT
ncbi:glycosyltransferase family 2 protein [Gloeocapsopsis dulcis]|uniref:Glycosyl transferase family A n=1 Tax=Gloeocapsopsis dulcis AAB1 = 1H9 TaxID=1433147 RepID=A0A6N8FRU0_9CHRO|nr:glycosyltransferase [Gloeocapsopsis dulcis]MUL35813.1 glycosyl transferase family A [Gloeocapsopsis dulcis AAB1 = 1H9]WNN87720.1 glycosyltransferase [Gloeocapsopsis dulcis]